MLKANTECENMRVNMVSVGAKIKWKIKIPYELSNLSIYRKNVMMTLLWEPYHFMWSDIYHILSSDIVTTDTVATDTPMILGHGNPYYF